MKGVLRYHFSGLKAAWEDGLAGEVKRSAAAFLILLLLAFGVCAALPDLRDQLVNWMLSALDGAIEDGTPSPISLFVNNLEATLFAMLYGLIPFAQLPALALGLNAMMLGVMAAWYVSAGISLAVYLAALIPHGIFELPALVMAFAMGLYVCGQMTRRCRKDESALDFWDCLVQISRVLLLIEIPLLAVAALVEAYITPIFTSLFI
jgi:stage II sporulation protein M